MLNTKKSPRPFLNTLMLTTLMMGTALLLAACQTTATTGTGSNTGNNADPVNAALDRASTEAATSGQHESLQSIERLYKADSMNPQLAVRYSRALRDNGRMTRAAMVLNPLMENQKTKTIGVITEFAAVQAAMGNYEIAEKNARAAVMQDANSAQAYHILGIALDAQGFSKQAEVSFRKALDNWSGDPSPVLNNLGLNLAAQGFLDEAISTLRRAAALSPNKVEIERNLRIVQALQVQPGTNTVPYAQTKAEQAGKKPAAKPITEKTAPVAEKTTPVELRPAAKAPAPAKEKSGGIVVEDLNTGDKKAEDTTAPDTTKTETPKTLAKPRGLND